MRLRFSLCAAACVPALGSGPHGPVLPSKYTAVPLKAGQVDTAKAGGGGGVASGFDLDWTTIDAGGGVAADGLLVLRGTIGQADPKTQSGGQIVMTGGFSADIAPSPAVCYADCDNSGELDIDDFICFQTLFATGDPLADCDQSGELDVDDFICFQTAFAVGCP